MLEREKLKRVNFNVEPSKWEQFKKVAKYNQSDSNKQLRLFIDKYLAENSQLVMQLNMQK